MFGSRASQRSIDRHQYIPPHIQQAINQHLQSTMHGGAARYMNGGLIPKHAQKDIARQLSKMPGHLKQYSGAYMEQHVMQPSLNFSHPANNQPMTTPAPMPDRMRMDHPSSIPSEQINTRFDNNLFAPDSQPSSAEPANASASPVPEQSQPPQEQGPYDFMNEPAKTPRNWNFLSGASMKQKIILVSGTVIVLIVLYAVASSILNRSPQVTALGSIAAQQSKIISTSALASQNATQQVNKNLAINIRLGLATNQTQLVDYLSSINKKMSSSFLHAAPSATISQELKNAQAQSNFDNIYAQIVQSQLNQYVQSLKQNIATASSASERKLLTTQYQDANILLAQANSAVTSLQAI